MLYILAIIGTLLLLFYIFLLFSLSENDWTLAAYAKIFDNMEKIKKLETIRLRKQEEMEERSAFLRKLFSKDKSSKKIEDLKLQNEQISEGRLKYISIFYMPGYVIQRKFDLVGRSSIYRKLYDAVSEFYGKKYAQQKTMQVYAIVLSLPILGLGLVFVFGAIQLALGNKDILLLLILGVALILVFVFAFVDEVMSKAKRRRESIEMYFPNMLSKFALLVTSGMPVSSAWKEVAYSEHTPLYRELQMTSMELDNLVSPQEAYGNFATRCNTKQTSRFAASIMQSIEKGNLEIADMLRAMAKEAWQERKYGAKKNAERANAKLLIPSMVLFITILFIILAPIAMSFSSF